MVTAPPPTRAWNRTTILCGTPSGPGTAVRLHLLDAAPSVSGVIFSWRAVSCSMSASTTGQTCTHTWLRSSFASGARCAPGGSPRAVLDRALGVRQGGDRPVRIAYDGELAHLRERDEPLVGGVVERLGVVQQHVLGRLEAGDPEVPQSPEVEPATHHRVDAADEVVLVHHRRAVVAGDGPDVK